MSVVRGMEIINMVLHTCLLILLSRILRVDADFIEEFVEENEEGSYGYNNDNNHPPQQT